MSPAVANPPPAAAAEARLLLFGSGGERFALDVAFVREVLEARTPTPVPLVPASVAGVVNHRGKIFTVVSFSRLAGLGAEEAASLVLLRLPDMAVGLAVGAVEGIEAAPGRLPDAGEGAPPEAPFLRRAAGPDGRLVHAVDAERLVDTINQLPDLARAGEGRN